jgi:protein-S-isoprenylcysteine O-methyltransferase Ste14
VWLGLVTLLGSPAALGLAVLALPLVALRSVLEERLLFDELDGYARYAERVRYRMLPPLW